MAEELKDRENDMSGWCQVSGRWLEGGWKVSERAPGKHFPGPDFPLLKMGKVNFI